MANKYGNFYSFSSAVEILELSVLKIIFKKHFLIFFCEYQISFQVLMHLSGVVEHLFP